VTQHLLHDSLTQFLSRLTRAEQLQVIMTHPFFTGHCPQCHQEFIPVQLDLHSSKPKPSGEGLHRNGDSSRHPWKCARCGWIDNSEDTLETFAQSSAPATNYAEVKRLGSYLVEAGLITQAQVDAALADQKVTGKRLGEVLVQRGWINQQTIEYLMKKIILPERQQ